MLKIEEALTAEGNMLEFEGFKIYIVDDSDYLYFTVQSKTFLGNFDTIEEAFKYCLENKNARQ